MRKSAGMLLYKTSPRLEVFLVHPGGPFWAKKDLGAWSIPKGEIENENPKEAAMREFFEETGKKIRGQLHELTPQKLKGGKVVYAFALEGDFNPRNLKSNPSKFGWPEVDRAGWFEIETAKQKINPGQVSFILELTNLLQSTG